MFRPASRAAVRAVRAPAQRRLVSTAPPTQKSRSWRSSAVRWGVAAAAIYYYNTSDIFADEPKTFITPQAAAAAAATAVADDDSLPTLETVAAERRKRIGAEAAARKAAKAQAEAEASPSSPEQLEAEADQQGAFNPETGEINWDCPCLGGMAHGPCGEQFKAAFSCFVYSKEEPKGMDCIDKFKGMQDCFRQYPDIYGEELDTDDDDDQDGPGAAAPVEGVDAAVAQDLAQPTAAAPKPATAS